MIGAFFALAQKAQQAIIVGLLVALGLAAAAALYYRGEAASAREELTRCAGDLALERANVDTLKGSIGRQNAAVDALADQANRRVAESEAARKRAEGEARRHRDAAAGILAAKPDDPADLCASALALYRRSRK